MKDIRRVWQYHGANTRPYTVMRMKKSLLLKMLRNIRRDIPLRNFLFVYDYGGKHIGVLAGGTARTVDKHTA